MAADAADRRGELQSLFIPVAVNEVRGDRGEHGDRLHRFDVAAVQDHLDALLGQQAHRLRRQFTAVVSVADDADPHGSSEPGLLLH